MNKIVDFLNPPSFFKAILRTLIVVALMIAWKAVVYLLVMRPFGVQLELGFESVQAVLVGAPFAIIAVLIARKQAELRGELAHQAATDVLTGLNNRRAFWRSATRLHGQRPEGLLMVIDADHFKRINDTHGHDAGDVCLLAIAEKLRRATRHGDLIGRLGGEEFAVFLPGADVSEAQAIGERICGPFEVTLANPDRTIRITMSAGAASIRSGVPLEETLRAADGALYQAKNGGRAQVVVSLSGASPEEAPPAAAVG